MVTQTRRKKIAIVLLAQESPPERPECLVFRAKKARSGWVQIGIDGKVKHLGTFDGEEAAARKYDEAAAPLGRAVNFPPALEKASTEA